MADNIVIPAVLDLSVNAKRIEAEVSKALAAASNFKPKIQSNNVTGSLDQQIRKAGQLRGILEDYVRIVRQVGPNNNLAKALYANLPEQSKKAAEAIGFVRTRIDLLLKQAQQGKNVSKSLSELFNFADKNNKIGGVGDILKNEVRAAANEVIALEKRQQREIQKKIDAQRKFTEEVSKSIAKGREEVRNRFDRGLQQKIRENEKFQENAAKARRERELDADIKATQKRKNMEAGVPGVTETPRDRFNQRVAFEIAEGTALVRRRKAEFADKKARQDAIAEEKTLNQVLNDQVRVREFLAKRQFQRTRGDDKETFAKLETFANADPAALVQQRLNGRGNGRGGNGNNRGLAGGDSPDNPEKIRRLLTHAKAVDANARAFHNAGVSAERFGELAGLALKRYGAFLVGTFALTQVLQGISQATTEFYNFEKAFTVLEQVLDTSEGKFLQLRKTITDVAVTTGVSATEITKGLGTLAQAGFGNADELEKVASVLAKITLAPSFDDIPSTIEGLIAIFGQFNLKLTDTQSILDKVNKLSVDYAIESRDFFEAVKRGGATFATAGGSFEEFASLLTLLRSSTRETASTLGIFFKSGLTKFNRPSSQALVETLIGKDAGKNLTLLEQFTKLAPKFSELGGTEQIQLANRLVGVQQSARLIKLLQEINKESLAGRNTADAIANATGSIDASVAKRLDDVGVSMNRVRESFGKFFIELGKTDEVKNFASSIADIAQSLAGMTKQVAAALPYIGALFGFLAFKQVGGFAGGLISELRGVAGTSAVLAASGNQATKSRLFGLPTAGGLGRSAGGSLRNLRNLGNLTSSGLAGAGLFLSAGGGDLFTSNERAQRRLQGTGLGLSGGATIGAALGSVIPGVGTAIGAGVGALAGGLGGFTVTQNNIRKEDEKFERDKKIADRQKIALENIAQLVNPNKAADFSSKNNLNFVRNLLKNNPNLTSKDITEAINADNQQNINSILRKEFSQDIKDIVQPFKNASSRVSGSRIIPAFGTATGGTLPEALSPDFANIANSQNASFAQARGRLKDFFESIKGVKEKLEQQFPDVTDGQSNALIKKVNITEQLNADVKEFFDQTLLNPGFINTIKTGLIGVSEEILKINEEYRRVSNVINNISIDPSSTRGALSGNITNRDLVSSAIGQDVLRNLTESFVQDTTKLLGNASLDLLKTLQEFGVSGLDENGKPQGESLTDSIVKLLDNPEQRKIVNRLTTIFPNQDQESVFAALSQLDENTIRPFIEKQVGIASRDDKFGEALRAYADVLSAQAIKLRELNDAIDQTSSAMADLRLSSIANRSDSLLRRQDVRNIIDPRSDATSRRGELLRSITSNVGGGVNLAALGQQAINAANVRNVLALRSDTFAQGNGGIADPELIKQANTAQIAANKSLLSFDIAVKQIQQSLGYATQAVDTYSQATNELRGRLQQSGAGVIGQTSTEFNKGTRAIQQFDRLGGFNTSDPFSIFKKLTPKQQKDLQDAIRQTPDAPGRVLSSGIVLPQSDTLRRIEEAAGENITDQRIPSSVRRELEIRRRAGRGKSSGLTDPIVNAGGLLGDLESKTSAALNEQLRILTELRAAEEDRVTILKSQQDFLQNNTSALLALTPSADAIVQQLKDLNNNLTKKADLGGGVSSAPNLIVGGTVDINFNLTADQAMTAIRPALSKAIGVEISKLGKLFESNDPDLASRIQAQAQTIQTQ